MIVTDVPHLADRCRHLATQARESTLHYEHTEIGYNYRLSNLLAAFGRGQLRDLERRVARRREVNFRYRTELQDVEGIDFMPEADYGTSTFWLSCMTLDRGLAIGPGEVIEHLAADDIEARPTWKPMHLQPVFAEVPARVDGTAQRLFETGVCLPSGSTLTESDQARVIARLREALSAP